jgi:hypothetical protein
MSIYQKRILLSALPLLFTVVTAFVIAGVRRGRAMTSSGISSVRHSSTSKSETSRRDNLPTLAPSLKPDDVTRVVRFVVSAEGIRPSQTEVTAGQVAVYMETLGGISDGLIVADEHGQHLGQLARAQGKGRGSQRLNLKPGEYRVFDATRPQNYATLIVK